MRPFKIASAFAVLALTMSTANATIWSIDSALNGTDGGYGYSSFHDTSGSNVMSGSSFGDILPSITGSYNDATGAIIANLTVDPVAAGANLNFSLTGTLLFSANGFLTNNSELVADFDGTNGALDDAVLGFMSGDICCNGNNNATPGLDPNSFELSSGVLTLWGADGFNLSNGSYSGSSLGMDLRIQLVPEPATLALFGLGLIGVAARKKS